MSYQPQSNARSERTRLAEQAMQVFDDKVQWRLSPLLERHLCEAFRKNKSEQKDGYRRQEERRQEHSKQTRQESSPDDSERNNVPDEPKTRPSSPVRYTRGHKLFRMSSYSYIDRYEPRNNVPSVPERLLDDAFSSLNDDDDDADDELDQRFSGDDSDSDSETVVGHSRAECLTPVPTTPKNRCVDLPDVGVKGLSISDVDHVQRMDRETKEGEGVLRRRRPWRRSKKFRIVVNNVSDGREGDEGVDELADKFEEIALGSRKEWVYLNCP